MGPESLLLLLLLPPRLIALVSVLVKISVWIFFTLITVDWTVSKDPVDSNTCVASVVTFPGIWLFTLLLVSLKIFLPVSNLGDVVSLGSGIKKDPITLPTLSLLSLRLDTFAWALEVWPANLRSFSTYP